MVARILKEEPDAIFIAGICMMGRHRRAATAEPLSKLVAPHGVYFVAGIMTMGTTVVSARRRGGRVRVLSNEKLEVDGLQILACRTGTRCTMATLRRCYAASIGSGSREHSVDHAPDHPRSRRPRGVRCSFGHTHLGRSYLGVGWRVAFTASLCRLSRIGKMQVSLRAEQERGTAAAVGIESRNCCVGVRVRHAAVG